MLKTRAKTIPDTQILKARSPKWVGLYAFCTLLQKSVREFEAAQTSEKPFSLAYEEFATLRYYNEFTSIDGLKNFSPRELVKFLRDYFHHTPHDFEHVSKH